MPVDDEHDPLGRDLDPGDEALEQRPLLVRVRGLQRIREIGAGLERPAKLVGAQHVVGRKIA